MDYSEAGVNIDEASSAVQRYKKCAERTLSPEVLNKIGSFAGLFCVPQGFDEPVLVSGTDGVGTKLDVAFAQGRYDTVGIDCVAMCVNDVLCHGARPLFFLDYIACGKLDAAVAAELVEGIAEGCVQAGAALLGGETAEMPGFYEGGRYDIAGFAVGIAEKAKLVDGGAIVEGDALIGLASSGVHSNGFSLVRRLIPKEDYDEPFGCGTLGAALLAPTKIYVKPVLSLMEKMPVHGMAHITGGGFYENIPRMFKKNAGLAAVINKGSWPIPSIFAELERRGANKESMFSTFNMGIGFVLAVPDECAESALSFFEAEGLSAYRIGRVEKTAGEPCVILQ